MLTNAKRVASVRAETYCNLFSLSVEHFNSVLEHYPVMRRTMESVAAERLNKIGKNPSMVSNRAELEDDMNTVNELIMQTTPIPTSGSDSSDDDNDSATSSRSKARGSSGDRDLKAKAKDRRLSLSPKKEASRRDLNPMARLALSLKKSKSDCYMSDKDKVEKVEKDKVERLKSTSKERLSHGDVREDV